jgi:hypothetical protein
MNFTSLSAALVLSFSVTAWAIPTAIIELQRRGTATDPVAEEVTESYGKRGTATDPVAEEMTESYGKL